MIGKLATLQAVLALAVLPAGQGIEAVPLQLTRIGLDLRVDYRGGTVGGTTTLVLRNMSDRPVLSVPLLLNRLMSVSRAADGSGAPLVFRQRVVVFSDDSIRQVNAVTVTPRHPIRPGDSLSVRVEYAGILVGYTETGSLYIQDRVAPDFTIIREDAYAFPVVGPPSWMGLRTVPRMPFAFTARVTAPAGLTVAMGGEMVERRRTDSLEAWSYRSLAPVPFLNITIAPYRQLEGPNTRIFYFPADSTGAVVLQQAATAAIGRYTAWYGPLSPAPHLVIMEIPEGFGSQASLAAGIIQTADAFRDRSELRQVYHELSHVWNVPDLDQHSPRWNEGLATFLQWRVAADLDGWNAWEARLQRTVQSLLERCAAPAPCSTTPFESYGRAGLTDISYPVGMLMFYALYRTLGEETFDRAYRGFFQRHHRTGATTADLVAAFRKESSLSDRIFEDWLTSIHWYVRLAAGETLNQMLAGYSAR